MTKTLLQRFKDKGYYVEIDRGAMSIYEPSISKITGDEHIRCRATHYGKGGDVAVDKFLHGMDYLLDVKVTNKKLYTSSENI